MKSLLILLLFMALSSQESVAQCACMGGSSAGGLAPLAGTSNIGVIRKDNIRILSFASYSYGNKYNSSDLPIDQVLVKSFSSSYLGLLAGYGINDNLTIDAELGIFIGKSQDFGAYRLTGSGLSHSTLYAKYNIFNSRSREYEWTAGLGARIPLNINEPNLPQNLRPSNGAFAAVLMSFFHKGFKSQGLHFMMINRAEISGVNSISFQPGASFINSIYASKLIVDKLNVLIEIRSDYRNKDHKYGNELADSGWNNLIFSPQLNYFTGQFIVSIFADLPLINNYNGKQIMSSGSAGLALTWQSKLNLFEEAE